MKEKRKKALEHISKHSVIVSFLVGIFLCALYVLVAIIFPFANKLQPGVPASIGIGLVTIIITTVGLSISGYIFLNNYFRMIIENDKHYEDIINELNKTYIRKVIIASIVSAISVGLSLVMIFLEDEKRDCKINGILIFYWLQHASYITSIGTMLYNFHFLCHIINPGKLIQKRAEKVVEKQIEYFKNWQQLIPSLLSTRDIWECEKKISIREIEKYGGKEDAGAKVLQLLKYIYEIETIITRAIEENAIKGRNRNRREALDFIFADTGVAAMKYKRFLQWWDEDNDKGIPSDAVPSDLFDYEKWMQELIETYEEYYVHLVILRNALLKCSDSELCISDDVVCAAFMVLRVTLHLFSNFIKLTRLNIGGGYFRNACFNWSDLSESNLIGGDFKNASFRGAVLRNCDLSNSIMEDADLSEANLEYASLSYVSLINANMDSANLSHAKMSDIIFLEEAEIKRHHYLRERIFLCLDHGKLYGKKWSKLNGYLEEIRKETLNCETSLRSATLHDVMLNSIDLSGVKLPGVSFTNSILSDSIWFCTDEGQGVKAYKANLRKSLLVQTQISVADFSFANLGQAVFVDVFANQSCFFKTNAVGMKIIGSCPTIKFKSGGKKSFMNPGFGDKMFSMEKLEYGNSLFSNWIQVNFNGINAVESLWMNSIINESEFQGAILKNSILYNIAANWVDMKNCDFSYAKLKNISMKYSKMDSIVFTRAVLKNVNFDGADIRKGIFLHAAIKRSFFRNCNLEGCNFAHTYISKCKFSNCELNGVYVQATTFQKVIFDEECFMHFLGKGNHSVSFIDCKIITDDTKKLFKKCEKEYIIVEKKHDKKYVRINSRGN